MCVLEVVNTGRRQKCRIIRTKETSADEVQENTARVPIVGSLGFLIDLIHLTALGLSKPIGLFCDSFTFFATITYFNVEKCECPFALPVHYLVETLKIL